MTTPSDHLRLVLQPRNPASDAQLLEQYLRGGGEAFTELVRRHGPMVFGVCRRVLRHHQEAEDAFQATFLVLAQKAHAVRPREQLPRWLYGVAYHTALKARTLLHKRLAREAPLGADEPAAPERRPETAEWQAILDEEVQQLPAKYRDPVLLCGLEGQPRKAAAQRLGLPEGTVAGRFFRAKEILAARLSRRGVALPAGAALTLAVPRGLMASAVRLGKLARLGGAGPLVPESVHLLSQGVSKAMSLSKIKLALACCLCLLTLTAGVGYLAPPLASSEEGRPPAAGAPGRPDREPIEPELVLEKPVREELRLSDNQVRKMKEAWKAGGALSPDEQRRRDELAREIEEMEKKLAALREEKDALARKEHEGRRGALKAAIFEHLSDPAQERLRQITLRRMGLRRLLEDPRIQARLGINDEQIKKLQELQKSVWLTDVQRFMLADTIRLAPMVNQQFLDLAIVTDNQEEVLKILTPEQRQAWEKMLGEPFPRPDSKDKE